MDCAFPRSGDGAAGEEESEGSIAPDVDARNDRVDLDLAGQKVGEGDAHAIAGGAVNRPGKAAKITCRQCRSDGAETGFGATDPALLGFGGSDEKGVTRGVQRIRESVEEGAVDTVVIGDQQIHERFTAERPAAGGNPKPRRA